MILYKVCKNSGEISGTVLGVFLFASVNKVGGTNIFFGPSVCPGTLRSTLYQP